MEWGATAGSAVSHLHVKGAVCITNTNEIIAFLRRNAIKKKNS